MTFSYILDGTGWATATIAHDGRQCVMIASYLSDSLFDVAQAAISLREGAKSVRFSFEDEPGEHRCIITHTGDADVRIRVLWFNDTWSKSPDEEGNEVFTCDCPAACFCDEVLACLERLLHEHGLAGYKKLWVSNDFPSEQFERLRELQWVKP